MNLHYPILSPPFHFAQETTDHKHQSAKERKKSQLGTIRSDPSRTPHRTPNSLKESLSSKYPRSLLLRASILEVEPLHSLILKNPHQLVVLCLLVQDLGRCLSQVVQAMRWCTYRGSEAHGCGGHIAGYGNVRIPCLEPVGDALVLLEIGRREHGQVVGVEDHALGVTV